MENERVEKLLELYGNMILRLSFTYLKNIKDAEDVVSDVFLKIIEKNPEFNDKDHEKAWIIRVTINMCKNKLKSFFKKNVVSISTIKEIKAEDKFKDNTVLNAVLSLPQDLRTVIHLFYYEGYKTKEIAKITGKSDGAVRSLLVRAREKLKIMLKEDYDFEQL